MVEYFKFITKSAEEIENYEFFQKNYEKSNFYNKLNLSPIFFIFLA